MDIIAGIITFIGQIIAPGVLAFFPYASPTVPPRPTPVPTVTLTPTPTNTPAPTFTPTPTPRPTAIPTKKPTPSPNPSPSIPPIPLTPSVSSQELDTWFTAYSQMYHVDRQKLWNIAVCESNLNPKAVNGDYGGLYQFAAQTWKTTRTQMNMDPNPDLRFHPEEAIRTGAYKLSVAGSSPWPACGK